MKGLFGIATGLLGAWSLLNAPGVAQFYSTRAMPPGPSGHWSTERVEMLSGRIYRGLIESEDDSWVYLTEIHQQSGRRTYLVTRPVERSSIAVLERLGPQERALLRQRIEQWVNRARIESAKMDSVRLSVVDRDRDRFQHYRGKWFDLDSSTDEETTRRIIVRVEQMFTAYRQVLPPRTTSPSRLRLVVLASLAQYQAYVRRYGLSVDNPAVFVEKQNLVVAGSEVARYTAELAKVKAQHARVRGELDELEKKLREKLQEISRKLQAQGVPRSEITRLLNQAKGEAEGGIKSKQTLLKRYDRENAEAFDKVTRRMFVRLYHEAFHAYLENYVYPHACHDVPLWLAEGLAMVFENGVLESDTLRIDAPNAAALARLQAEIRKGEAMPLDDLLVAGPQDFLLVGGEPPAKSDRYYAYAWGLVYYLTFEKPLLGSPALDEYVAPAAAKTPPARRLEKLTGKPLADVQSAWQEHILSLR